MRVGAASIGLVLLAGCGVTEGPLLHALDGGEPERDAAPTLAADGAVVGQPLIAQDAPWQYQLVGDVDAQLDAELFVIDLFDTEQSMIDALRARGVRVVAYLTAGTREPYRNDADQFPASAVGRELDEYPAESWLDVRDARVRELMVARLDEAQKKRFDGVLPTNLTAYQHDSGFALSADDQLQYSTWLADRAHERGLATGLSGDYGQLAALAPHFDFAMQYGCIARADCALLDPLAAQGKPVLDVEVEGDLAAICAAAKTYRVNTILKRPDFGAYRMGCQ